jgi:anti-sigma regulatory factor (Ser/Thr protein kinase)
VNEALANVIRHAYEGADGKPIRVLVEYCAAEKDGPGELRVTIRDWGNGVNPVELPAKPQDPLRPGGLGLVCLGKLMDDVAFAPQPDGGMLLTMVKRK